MEKGKKDRARVARLPGEGPGAQDETPIVPQGVAPAHAEPVSLILPPLG